MQYYLIIIVGYDVESTQRVFTIANGQLVLVHVRYKDLGYLQTKLLIEKITSKYGAPSISDAIFLHKASTSSETIEWRTENTYILLVAGEGSFSKVVVVNYTGLEFVKKVVSEHVKL